MRRGVGLVFFILITAIIVSMAGLAMVYLMIGREPSVSRNSTLVLRIRGDLPETSDDLFSFVRARRNQSVREIVEDLRKAKVDSRISSVILAPADLESPFWAKIQEIH